MTELEAKQKRREHFRRMPVAKRVCLRCQNLVPKRHFHDGCCAGCVSEMVEFDLRSDPWAFKVDWDLVGEVVA